ncbi:hypothetical protein NE857_14120 [Nocardiopsis exhalans]|uniref:Methyltransferase n=1 Tax=Nocardiopsis exhalans TaxID=163604 RepID=A0ABY5DE67_9ACTN|nr:class I SAM-dependent methyltransferase [Nocardiopsis exhalans]USY22639.1 hypothetical protein NE857_14120 [Nocardiopsis exhalans]
MAQRTVAQKMGVKEGSRAHLVNAPASALDALQLPELELPGMLSGKFDYLHLFVTTQQQLRSGFGELRDHLNPGGMLWVSWPRFVRGLIASSVPVPRPWCPWSGQERALA